MDDNHIKLSSHFNITVQEISELLSAKNKDLLDGGVENLAKKLNTSIESGIPEDEEIDNYKDRIETFGTNTYDEPPHKSWFKLFIEAFNDTTLKILIGAAIISLILALAIPKKLLPNDESNSWFEPIAILVAVLIVTLVQSFNDWSKDKQFRSLNKSKNNFNVKVIRSGNEMQIKNYDVLVGDVVILDTGDQIPADGVFIEGFNLRIDESSLTGESESVKKSEDDPFLFSGCKVTDGVGRMLVLATGMNSEWGKLLSALQEENVPTPLQERLDQLAALIGKVGLGFAVATFIALLISWIVRVSKLSWQYSYLIDWVGYFIIAVTILVVAIPEGLPLAVTISLAYSMKEMMKDQNLVRHLIACETMGGATTICSDKTGTLTENKMKVVEGWIAGGPFRKIPFKRDIPQNIIDLLVAGISINTKASLNYREDGEIEFVGNKTECALLDIVHRLGIDYKSIRKENQIKFLLTFSSSRKRMSSLVTNKLNSICKDDFILFTKGASEIILERCNSFINSEGEVQPLQKALRNKIQKSINKMASKGLRTLALGYKGISTNQWDESLENDLIFVAVVGIKDPVRKGVPKAVNDCQKAGIIVRMVTGDNVNTATKIAKECGILNEGDEKECIMEGLQFQQLSDEELDEKLPTLRVLARAQPLDKRRLVERLQASGEVVAVTGDGTNDSAALRLADVGLAMGIQGTEVAKEAADIIILDDNFISIVNTVLWGRNVYDNIRKFIQFQLTVNLVALIIAFVGAISQYGTPLTALQLLWVNLIMDTFAALALGTEKPTRELLNRKPYGKTSPLLSNQMIRNIVGQSILQCTVLFIMLYAGDKIFEIPNGKGLHVPNTHYTLVFNTFVFLQLFNEFNCRTMSDDQFNIFKGLSKNFIFIGVMLTTLVVQILIVEYGGNFTQTKSLSLGHWFLCMGLGSLSIPFGLILRFIKVPDNERKIEKDINGEAEELDILIK